MCEIARAIKLEHKIGVCIIIFVKKVAFRKILKIFGLKSFDLINKPKKTKKTFRNSIFL